MAAYRQLRNPEEQIRLNGYANFGFLVLDVCLPFGRADSARIFQTVAHTIIRAFRIRCPELFMMKDVDVLKLKKFKYIMPISNDLFKCINYLDDQLFAQYNQNSGPKQLKYLK